MSSTQDQTLQSSPELSDTVFLQGDADREAELNQLPLATECSLVAALTQLISLASLCVAVSFVKWILLIPSKNPKVPEIKSSASYMFGVPYKVEVVNLENITTEEWVINPYGVTGDTVLILMTSACLMSLIFGFVAFLLDFVELQPLANYRATLATSLHILGGLFLLTLVVICWWWFAAVDRWLLKVDAMKFQMRLILGESFYISLSGLAFVIVAVIVSCQSMAILEDRVEEERAVSGSLIFRRSTV